MANLLDDMKKKGNLNRGTHIKNIQNVSKEEVINNFSKKTFSSDEDINTDLIDVNIRVNQGSRNLLNALQVLGYGDSHKTTVELILEDYINSLKKEDQLKIRNSALIFKEKDIQKSKKLKAKKKSV